MAFFYQSDSSIAFDFTQLESRVKKQSTTTLETLAKRFHASFIMHAFFLLLFSSSLILVITSQASIMIASSIALLLLTIFSWLCFRSYEKTKLKSKLKQEIHLFLQETNKLLPLEIDIVSKQSALMQSLEFLQNKIFDKNLFLLKIHPFTFDNKFIRSIAFSLHFCHLKQYIFALIDKINHHNSILIEQMPTSCIAHKNFAKALLHMYNQLNAKKQIDYTNLMNVHRLFNEKNIQRKKERLIKAAISELELANSFSANDQWTLKTLAHCFKILDKKEDEIKIMQNLYELYPTEKNILYQLATLYFETAKIDKALTIYEALKQINPKYAKALLRHYHYTI